MKITNIYPKVLMLVTFMVLGFSSTFAQLDLKIQLMEDSLWGVYVKPKTTITPSLNTITGSAQVTIVAPTGFTLAQSQLEDVSGSWSLNSIVIAPPENSDYDYFSIGFTDDDPHIDFIYDTETLLFTIERVGDCPDTLYLIDNVNDPFLPENSVNPGCGPGTNSACNNPGNEFSVWDAGNGGAQYFYSENYAFSAWSCHDCDMDGILNALEDTNGNGTFDSGVDVSDLCDICDPIHPETAIMDFYGEDVICEGDAVDTAFLVVTITGGWTPYSVVYTDGSTQDTVNNYTSGDTIKVVPTSSSTYSLVSVTDINGCEADPDSLSGSAPIIVEGPLTISDHPDDVDECSGNSTFFAIAAANGGDGNMRYKWQVSTDGGSTFIDLDQVVPYGGIQTDTLAISDVAGLNANQYRAAIFSISCDTVFSNAATLTVEGPIAITQTPDDAVICATDNITFTSGGVNNGQGSLSLQWEISTDGGSNYSDVPAAAPYSNTTSAAMTISNATASLDGNYYRLRISTGECANVYSDPALLNVEGPITITDQPDDVSACAGQPVFFFIQYTNPGSGDLIYQWQENNGSGWVNLDNDAVYAGTKSDTLTITDVEGLDGYDYQVLVSTGACSTVTSTSAELTIDGTLTWTTDPQDTIVCSGNGASFTVGATISQGSISFKWQRSSDGSTWVDLQNAAVYSGVTSTELVISEATDTIANFYYRALVLSSTGTCDEVGSEEGQLFVEGPLSVNTQPVDVTECSGNSTEFEAIIDNPGYGTINYYWEISINNGVNYFPLSNTGVYNGVNTTKLSINNVAGLSPSSGPDYLYRLCAFTSMCDTLHTNSAALTVEGPFSVSAQPVDVEICDSGNTSFSVTLSNIGNGSMTYQWQVTSDGINWNPLSDDAVYSGTNSTLLQMTSVPTGYSGRCYRLQVTTGECTGGDAFYSDEACLIVEGPISITDQPDDVTECSDDFVQFAVGTLNGGAGTITFQWQESTDNGSTWNDLTNTGVYNGTDTDTLSISELTGLGGNQYQVIIQTAQCASITSSAATLTVEGPLSFVDPPDDITRCAGDGVTFQVTVVNQGAGGTPTIHWELSNDGGINWSDVPNSAPYAGITSTTLVINDIAGLHGTQYRAVANTSTCENVESPPATVFVEGPISFTDQPDDATVCADGTANFTIETQNLGLGAIQHQWQVNDGVNPWVNLANGSDYAGVTTGNLSVTNLTPKDGYQFRVIIQTTYCSSDTSNVVTLTVEGPMSWTAQPVDVTQCSGGSTTFSATATIANSGTINYIWQYSTDGITWIAVPDNATYDDVATNTLTVNDVAGLNGYLYRAVATSGVCSGFESDPAELTVEGPLSIDAQPVDVTTCSDLGVVFAVDVSNAGEGFIFYQWEESSDNGATWNELFNQGRYNGVTTDTLSIDTVTNLYNFQYRVRAWTQSCSEVTSVAATVLVEGPISIIDMPDDTTVCSGSPTAFWIQTSVPGNSVGSLNYQWELSTDGGTSWNNVPNSAPYNGPDNDTLRISDVANLYNYKYRCLVSSANCAAVFSSDATLTVEGPVVINTQPVNTSTCNNTDTLIITDVSNSGSGVMALQWQESQDSGSSWSDISNGADFAGVTTEVLRIKLTYGRDGYMYHLVITTDKCTVISNDVTLTVRDACLDGTCDFDLDGLDNNSDEDDDDDGLDDIWEDYITNNSLAMVGVQHTMNNCDPDSDGDGITDDQEDPDGDDIQNGEETDGDLVFDGDPLDPCDPILSSNCIGIVLDLRVYLQGAMMNPDAIGYINDIDALDTLMRDDLRENAYIPASEPYTALGFEHKGDGGGESVTDSATVFGVTGANAIVDWVFVEIRSSIQLDSVITTRSALLQRDGDIVDVDGVSYLTFPNTVAGPYFVSIKHRNHLGVMTVEAGDLSPMVQRFDYVDTSFVSHGTNAMIEKDGRYYMWAGDLSSDQKSIYQGPSNDLFNMLLKVVSDPDNTEPLVNYISPGYTAADIDLDGKTIYQGPKNDRAKLLFNVIFSYPENGSTLANYVLLSQLP